MTDTTSNDQPPTDLVPAIRTIAMPADANSNGDIFGGWMMSQMDLAGGVAAVQRAQGRIVTVAVDAMTFHLPVNVGDLVSCYSQVTRVGRSSLTVKIDAWVQRRIGRHMERVTSGSFTYVAVDEKGRPRPVPPENTTK
ncbi:MAG: acyl-CoA thioesterase [Dongiales bacterium]